MAVMNCAIFDTKPYDREFLSRAAVAAEGLRFFDFRLAPETVPAVESCPAVCVFVNDKLDRAVIAALSQKGVKHIALRCAGFNNVDLEAASEYGIVVTRVPAYSPHAVAEHTVALLMTLNRKIHRAYNRVREQNFSLNGLVGFDLHGKTIGIVGTGKIGRIAAEIFRGFGCRILAADPFRNEIWAAERGIVYVDLEDLLENSDVISLHSPLFPETYHLLDAQRFALMKRGAFVVNTSRGKLIDTHALIDALKSGHIGGVALDVYEEEEGIFFEDHSGHVLQDDELSLLLNFPNVLITSHQAFLTQEALAEIARVTVENLQRVAAGAEPLEGTRL
jgi:D-lactate dehydrogenase